MNTNISYMLKKKIDFYRSVIQNTYVYVQKNKKNGILALNDVNICIEKLQEISILIPNVNDIVHLKTENIAEKLQSINDELSSLLKIYGTEHLEELLVICFGNNMNISVSDDEYDKFELLVKYFHPIGYKVLQNKKSCHEKEGTNEYINDDSSDEKIVCNDILNIYKQFYIKVHGIKIEINLHNKKSNKIMVYGIVDDVLLSFVNNTYVDEKLKLINDNIPEDDVFHTESFKDYLSGITLKDIFIYDKNDIYNKYIGYNSQLNEIKQQQIAQVVKKFIADDIFNKRITLITLLTKHIEHENLYLAYLLYDILTNESNSSVDTQEQMDIYDSFPSHIKKHFKYAMKKTIDYTNELTNFDVNKIPLEQQICLLKTNETVKEKAMIKLKEVKAKSEDSGSKARQYLDGLLKIPFCIYKKEPILSKMDYIKDYFKDFCNKYDMKNKAYITNIGKNQTSIHILQHIKQIENYIYDNKIKHLNKIKQQFQLGDKSTLLKNVKYIDNILKIHHQKILQTYNNLSKKQLINYIENTFHYYSEINDNQVINRDIHNDIIYENKHMINPKIINTEIEMENEVKHMYGQLNEINDYITNIKNTLDKAVYGQNKAKKQIERIIGQWINGEQNGYCFGFEGAPGIGKTSLAKRGLSECLKDENGVSRPFSMIQMGGDSNGSTLHGHNYTYVGSTWGSIVQILIDKKCMNPIIFIDEIDKISKTEHGKEIVSILTHLLDPAQNDCFQDKYFNGIDIDLSKALFILSYNDVEAIDKILLDRVHRIKFDNLTLDDKIVICNEHLLPDIYKKMGLENVLEFTDETLKFIIDEYTAESGVRKLKEILFEIIGEINLEILKNRESEFLNCKLPIQVEKDDIKNKYFKEKHGMKHKKIHLENKIGTINGLWANALGRGGIIPIQVSWRPSNQFLSLHLTGMQGDVMKESMNVALTKAWELTSVEQRKMLTNNQQYSNCGIHIHCPEGATPKDGPSAGTAITSAIYSLFNEKKIKNDIAITGEICLDGNVTEIGGLDLKIMGAIKAGVKQVLFPKENTKDYETFMEKYHNTDILDGILFHSVNTIEEVLPIIFE